MLTVTAIGITPRIYDMDRDRIQEFLDGTHPMSSHKKKYDTGIQKKTILDQSPLGPNEISGVGDKTSHDGVGSGYDKGLNPGGRADEESGPGNASDPDPEQNFTSHDQADLTFKNDFDFSSKWSPLNENSRGRDQKVTDHLMNVHRRPAPNAFPRRKNVDNLTKQKISSSLWTHYFTV